MIAGSGERARELLVFCDGFDEGGLYPEFTRRARVVARDLLAVLDEFAAERSAREALQARCRRQQDLLGERVLEAIDREHR